MKVLMIEDERDLADALTAILQKNDYSVDNAYDGESGFNCALTGAHDIIILDIMLPKKDGLQVLREIRCAGIRTPILICSARDEIRTSAIGLDGDADAFISKPIKTDELLEYIQKFGTRGIHK